MSEAVAQWYESLIQFFCSRAGVLLNSVISIVIGAKMKALMKVQKSVQQIWFVNLNNAVHMLEGQVFAAVRKAQ
ncbi:hypothetical protein [Paenibacillus tuaregi]|uniref:hypothetical protein n=1 Tax=Paenibacillus tuaregi TaxID=1816681 RepID=UPI000838CEC0|nr:hypothetical protein [Paenibacillus tuaregi]